MDVIGGLLKNLRDKKFIHSLETVSGALILLICNHYKEINCLLRAIDLFSKYASVVPLKDKRGISIANVFQKIISKRRKPNKIWTDQFGEFYNKLFKRFLKINNTEMDSTYNEGKSVVAEKFI